MGDVPNTSPQIRCVRTFCHRFEPGLEVDLIEVSHNGYAFMEQPVFHMRRVMWFKPGVWLIDGVLTGTGSHTLNLSFNFAPQQLKAVDSVPNAYAYRGKQIQVNVLPLLQQDLGSRVLEGSLTPKGGWVSYGYAVKVPAPQLIYTRVGPTPTRFLTALVRDGKGEVHRQGKENGLAVDLVVNSGNKTWHVTFGGEARQWAIDWAEVSRE
jgi:hypothetical protein